MKTTSLLLWLLLLFALSLNAQEKTGTLRVMVTGLKHNQGIVRIALSNTKVNYDSREEAYQGIETHIQNKKTSAHFTNIPHGTYAIKLYHDENSNGKLDSNFLGIPKEPYGFSNNVRGRFGPPSFKKAQFTFHTDTLTVTIKIQ
jgi:uncharacterized protein (DUF2141 family)